ncbi:hypothetical protein DBR47_09040 [Paucibacter sp. KBW04]|uniref:hypothetical protein n=1 Tax=Paucibacter sp. KBW04 TaxID=2153361 RepID=UPI000F56948C|nr:hypothetical protein [Paucibacter sp. KBW04]RQO60493.1 hypothetical protein DBR47_09040 [Paucibacter sp. KBW04]
MSIKASSNTPAGKPSLPQDPKAREALLSQQRLQLRAEECARRGVRFLPAQVMRPLYEKAGLI